MFSVDLAHSTQIVSKLEAYAQENQVIVRYEALKLQIRQYQEATKHRCFFFRPFHSERPLREHLVEMQSYWERRKK